MSNDSGFNEQAGEQSDAEAGSDELLSADNLRLPEAANILVRLHAVRAWLKRRRSEASLEVGEAALAWQAAIQQTQQDEVRPRRRAWREDNPAGQVARAQAQLQEAQGLLAAFDEAQELLEECIAHTQGERVLVEYYLLIEQRLLDAGYTPDSRDTPDTLHEEHPVEHTPWYEVMAEVLRRVEHVGIPEEP